MFLHAICSVDYLFVTLYTPTMYQLTPSLILSTVIYQAAPVTNSGLYASLGQVIT